jgi:hypothetical protein
VSPLLRPDVTAPGSLGRCSRHRRPLLPSRVSEAERLAAERVAKQARERLADMGEPAPEPARGRRKAERPGWCPDCADDAAEAAWTRLMEASR